MMMLWLLAALVLILGAAEMFTNALEHLGTRLRNHPYFQPRRGREFFPRAVTIIPLTDY